MICFSEKGYAATTLGDIVERTGQTKGAFYGHFQSKEEFFFHIMRYRQSLSSGWTNIPKQFNPADTTLEEVLLATLAQLQQMWKAGSNWILVLVDFYQQTKHDPELHEMLKREYRGWVAEIETYVNVLREQGWISHNKDPHLIAMQIIAFNEGFTTFSVLFGGSNREAFIQGMVKLLA